MANGKANRTKNRRSNAHNRGSRAHRGTPPGKQSISKSAGYQARQRS